ncbi:MAG TPA: hypothetical protein VM869_19205 [Enhygromyxa sp.]|nr:hypothetical protein [Enhygromyxa sp.]
MDRVFVRAILIGFAILALAQCCAQSAYARQPGIVDGDFCDAPDGPREPWTREAKARTRARVQAGCKALRAAPIVCAYYQAIVSRESFGGASSRRHTLGSTENGLGPMGLSLRMTANKWPGDDEDPAYCTPEVSLVVAHEIVWRAVTVYGADSIADVQAIYGGRWRCVTADRWRWITGVPMLGRLVARWLPGPDRECMPAPTAATEARICERMDGRGYNCHALITIEDLGRRIPLEQRRSWALSQAAAFASR